MHPVILHSGSVTLYSFGLLLALAVMCGSICVVLVSRKARLSMHNMFDNVLFIVFAGVVGARLGYVLINFNQFRAPVGTWSNAFALWQGGLTFYGAIIGGLIGTWLAFRHEGKSYWRWLDVVFFGFLIGAALGQLGCWYGGCSLGVVSSARLSIDHQIPVQLFEAAWAFLLWTLGLYLYYSHSAWRRGGMIFFAGGSLYFAGRIVLDMWRADPMKWYGAGAMQWADLALLLIVIVILVLYSRAKMLHNDE